MKWLLRTVLAAVVLYIALAAAVTAAMLQPPSRFGQIMRYVPAPLVWGLLRPRMTTKLASDFRPRVSA